MLSSTQRPADRPHRRDPRLPFTCAPAQRSTRHLPPPPAAPVAAPSASLEPASSDRHLTAPSRDPTHYPLQPRAGIPTYTPPRVGHRPSGSTISPSAPPRQANPQVTGRPESFAAPPFSTPGSLLIVTQPQTVTSNLGDKTASPTSTLLRRPPSLIPFSTPTSIRQSNGRPHPAFYGYQTATLAATVQTVPTYTGGAPIHRAAPPSPPFWPRQSPPTATPIHPRSPQTTLQRPSTSSYPRQSTDPPLAARHRIHPRTSIHSAQPPLRPTATFPRSSPPTAQLYTRAAGLFTKSLPVGSADGHHYFIHPSPPPATTVPCPF